MSLDLTIATPHRITGRELFGRARIVLVQTQAEAAGAQEISRILGNGLELKGYDVSHVFFFRRTAAFDAGANTVYCSSQRPDSLIGVLKMLTRLVRHLRVTRPNAVVCFQHYGNIVGTIAARLAGVRIVITNRTTANSLVPKWARYIDMVMGCTGLFKAVVVNSKEVEDEYSHYPASYRSRV